MIEAFVLSLGLLAFYIAQPILGSAFGLRYHKPINLFFWVYLGLWSLPEKHEEEDPGLKKEERQTSKTLCVPYPYALNAKAASEKTIPCHWFLPFSASNCAREISIFSY